MVVSDCPINNSATGQIIVWCLPGGKTLPNPWWSSLVTTYASLRFSALRNNINNKLPTWSSYQTFNSIPSYQIISHTLLVMRAEFSGITSSISWLRITLTSYMTTMASQITSLTVVYSIVSGADQQKTSKLRVAGLCAENVSIWWRHHVMVSSLRHIVFSNHDIGHPDKLVFFFNEEIS